MIVQDLGILLTLLVSELHMITNSHLLYKCCLCDGDDDVIGEQVESISSLGVARLRLVRF